MHQPKLNTIHSLNPQIPQIFSWQKRPNHRNDLPTTNLNHIANFCVWHATANYLLYSHNGAFALKLRHLLAIRKYIAKKKFNWKLRSCKNNVSGTKVHSNFCTFESNLEAAKHRHFQFLNLFLIMNLLYFHVIIITSIIYVYTNKNHTEEINIEIASRKKSSEIQSKLSCSIRH